MGWGEYEPVVIYGWQPEPMPSFSDIGELGMDAFAMDANKGTSLASILGLEVCLEVLDDGSSADVRIAPETRERVQCAFTTWCTSEGVDRDECESPQILLCIRGDIEF